MSTTSNSPGPQSPPARTPYFWAFLVTLVLFIAESIFLLVWHPWQSSKPADEEDGPPETEASVKTGSEIRQIGTAIAAFNRDFNLTGVFFPSRLKLCENFNYYGNNQLDVDSKTFLLRMFPRMQYTWAHPGIDWNGNGKIDPANAGGTVILEGDQCLVFFLGGIPDRGPNGPGCLGFSRAARNPAQPGGDRKGPYFEFDPSRLKLLHANQAFFSYADPNGTAQPFLYFSSNKIKNGYNPYGTTDCPTAGVWPYQDRNGNYVNPNSCQIISAGPDGKFGPGTDLSLPAGQRFFWPPDVATFPPAARDDQTNFYRGPLGRPERALAPAPR